MGRNKYGKKNNGSFVQLPEYMTDSKAWKALSCKAIWVYVEIKKKFRGHNENKLTLTYTEVRYKLSSATYRKALKELVKLGFIDIVKQGGLLKTPSIYGLSNRWVEISKSL